MYQPSARSRCQPIPGSSTSGSAAPRLRTSISVSRRSMPSIVTTNSTRPATIATSEMTCGTERLMSALALPRFARRDAVKGVSELASMAGPSSRRTDILGNQPLNDDDIAPLSIEPGVLFVDADFAKAHRRHQAAAGGVLDEDSRYQLPDPRRLAGVDQGPHRHRAGAAAAPGARDVDG